MSAYAEATLLRYWLFPGKLRRLSRASKLAVAVGYLAIAAGPPLLVLRQNPGSITTGILLIPAACLFIGLPSLLSIVCMCAGATLIAAERQKETWEPLL